MTLRWVVGVVLCLTAVAAIGPGASAAGPSRSQICTDEHLKCFRVTVPLDPSGTVPGHVKLWVQEYVPQGRSRGVMFLLAGGPGQASTSEFDITQFGFWARSMPGYTLVDFDPRGTGLSDPLVCDVASFAGCAAQLGPQRQFYGTVENAIDLDAVRQALGAPKIAIYGASYGTDVATTYARMYPGRVTRLLLDSVAAPFNALPLVAGVVNALPQRLQAYCAHVCTGATRNYPADAVSLVRQAATAPLQGRVLVPSGRYVHVKIDVDDLVELFISSDLSDGVAAELPAAVVAARGGDLGPLLRIDLAVNPSGSHVADQVGEYNAVNLATVCDDGPFPWQPDTPVGERPALVATALGKIPAAAFGPIGPAGAKFGTLQSCLRWPVSTLTAPQVPDTYPNIPVLAVSGDLELRSPTFEDRQLLAHFPRGHLLTVVNGGHAPLADRESPCLSDAVRRWLAGASVPRSCTVPRRLTPMNAIPAAGPAGTPAEALADVQDTLLDAQASWALTRYEIAGLAAGRLTITGSGFELTDYGLTGGIDLDGGVDMSFDTNSPVYAGGVVRVLQHGSTIGTLALQPDGTLDGTLDGDTVTASRLSKPAPPAAPKPFSNWSSWTPAPGGPAAVANEIAAHVGAAYLLQAGGSRLDRVISQAAGVHFFALKVEHGFERNSPLSNRFFPAESTWTYTLCGAAAQCTLPGEASVLRGQVTRREGLELALYTLQFDPSVDSVVVVLPPAPGADGLTALYFTRDDLGRQLHEPLARTLPLTTPPLPTNPDRAETGVLDSLTIKHLCFVHVHDDGPVGDELVLHVAT